MIRTFPYRRLLFRVVVSVFLFLITTASGLRAEPVQKSEIEWEGVERIVAVGDLHGDYGKFVFLLQEAGLINKKRKWIGGQAHLVQTGDVVDRGAHSRKIMDLLMRLERQAKKAGGRVHALLGNHEIMNLVGDLRYVSPEEYKAFRDFQSEQRRREFYEQDIQRLRETPPPEGLPKINASYQREWESRHPLGYFVHRFEFGPDGTYGKWLRGHNAVVKINGTIFLHGGLSPKYADRSLAEINAQMREELADYSKAAVGMAVDPEGPFWYRGLALEAEATLEAHLENLFRNHGAQRMVMGHTVTAGAVIPRFGGRVVLIDVGLSDFYGGRRACLILEGEQAYALHRGEKLKLPSGNRSDFLAYLKKAASLDPEPSPLAELIRLLESPQVSRAEPGGKNRGLVVPHLQGYFGSPRGRPRHGLWFGSQIHRHGSLPGGF